MSNFELNNFSETDIKESREETNQETGQEMRELVENRVEQALQLVGQSASEVLSREELHARVAYARASLEILGDAAFKGAYYEQFRTNEGSELVPAFVRSEVLTYGYEDELGHIVMQERYAATDTEASAILLHEFIHKLGPKDEIARYEKPIRNEQSPDIFHATEYIARMGPLYQKQRDLFFVTDPEEITEGKVRYWETIEKNYEQGEWRLWEAITDRESTKLLREVDPDYTARTGYRERVLLDELVNHAQEDIEITLKQGLYNGERAPFENKLEEVYGKGAYKKLQTLMAESEKIQLNTKLQQEQKTALYKEKVEEPFREIFLF